jgi:hypothetical protein
VFGGAIDISSPVLTASVEQASVMPGDELAVFAFGTPLKDVNGGAVAGAPPMLNAGVTVIGGTDSNLSATSTEECAAMNNDGTFKTFDDLCGALKTPRDAAGMVVTSSFVYVIGGNNNQTTSTDLGTVERAQAGGTGLGSFQADSVHLLTQRSQFATVATGNFVYVIGGTQGAGEIEVAPINADGTLGAFADSGVHLVTARLSHAAVALGSTLYVIGGRDSAKLQPLDSIEAAPIHADGSLGPFAILPNVKLQTARYGHSADVVGNSIYVLGGQIGVGEFLTSIERARLQ